MVDYVEHSGFADLVFAGSLGEPDRHLPILSHNYPVCAD